MKPTYKIIRFFKAPGTPAEDVPGKTGLTLEEAQAHCQSPDSSSWTCKTPEGEQGEWFDGYTLEDRT